MSAQTRRAAAAKGGSTAPGGPCYSGPEAQPAGDFGAAAPKASRAGKKQQARAYDGKQHQQGHPPKSLPQSCDTCHVKPALKVEAAWRAACNAWEPAPLLTLAPPAGSLLRRYFEP